MGKKPYKFSWGFAPTPTRGWHPLDPAIDFFTWGRLFGKAVLLAVMTLVLFVPGEATAKYSIGLVGIQSAVQGAEKTNIAAYVDMQDKRDPMEFAQSVFTDIMTDELATTELETIDLSRQANMARRDEIIFQLKMGDPSKALQLSDKKLDYLMYGYISNFTVTHRESLGSNNISVEVSLSAHIVESATGKAVFVATGKGTAASHGVDLNKDGDKISTKAWTDALEKALTQIADKVKKEV
ncbi:MAG: hypothetical protein IJ849_01655 [Selenomonadaceae bacterium]|nr:hypothetical protein [Selenomonadaceae bacterium]